MGDRSAQKDDMKSLKNWFESLSSRERRRAERQEPVHLVGYYWDGAAPLSHDVRDISTTGLFLATDARWYPGTQVMLSLQRVGAADTDPDRSISINAKVVRAGADGVGFSFVVPNKQPKEAEKAAYDGADRSSLKRFSRNILGDRGQALIEYILLLPLLFLLLVNVVNFGGFFFAWITVANAARAGADYAILGGASMGSLGPATASQIGALITQDISSLPNRASLAVNICKKDNGTVTVLSGTCSSIPADAEPTAFVLLSVDVTYQYLPFIPAGFQFPNLNVYATIPPQTIHRRAVMRVIQ
jgi:Flp pilus assembly protein TadG